MRACNVFQDGERDRGGNSQSSDEAANRQEDNSKDGRRAKQQWNPDAPTVYGPGNIDSLDSNPAVGRLKS
eukprot:COSAG02_NODE_16_length_56207_cov_9.816122_34_plen_70_part_00